MSNSEDLDQQQNQESEEQPDPIALLAEELAQIREALGLGESPASSSLLQRLNSIESKLAQPERERNLPETITHAQLRSAHWMRQRGIQLEDIGTKIRVVPE